MTYEKVADDLELAAHLQEQLNLAGRKACEDALKPETPKGFNGKDCVDCEDPLPPVRLAYGRCRCTPCQIEVDRLKKLGRM